MSYRSDRGGPLRWRYLLLAALIFVVAAALLVALWQAARLFGGDTPPTAVAVATLDPPTTTPPGATPSPAPTATPTRVPTATPALTRPEIAALDAAVDEQARTVRLEMAADGPPDRRIAEALLWYDTEAGRGVRRFPGPLPITTTLDYTLDPAVEGLTTTVTTGELDYWWLVRDTAGDVARAGGTVTLGPALEPLVVTPTVALPPADFTWAVSDTEHYTFRYAPGTEAERDLALIAQMGNGALALITPTLEAIPDDKLTLYLVPRVFWQGGAAYGDKIILLSYLDRNYTAVETWSYFTHEGTHALVQDFIQPKDEEGGPDGVLVEGLAVWASGGHYRREPIDERAAVVADSDTFIPLAELRAGPFYDFQHEISYLEAGSFVKFLVDNYGLDAFKSLYGRATGKPEHDEALVEELYGKSYGALEEEWLAYLDTLSPAEEEAEAWGLEVRYFDLMRRYQTELDPDARILPHSPTEWQSDTLKIFLNRRSEPVNLVLETALIDAQALALDGDLDAAAALLEDVEGALDAGGDLDAPSLAARLDIVTLLAAQDRAMRRADAPGYRATLDGPLAASAGAALERDMQVPITAYRQELVRLALSADGDGAEGMIRLHARALDGPLPGDGQLFAVRFVRRSGRWLMAGREAVAPAVSLPPEDMAGE